MFATILPRRNPMVLGSWVGFRSARIKALEHAEQPIQRAQLKRRNRHRSLRGRRRSLRLEHLEDRNLLTSWAMVSTDQQDYAPGSVAEIIGTAFDPDEAVTLQVVHRDALAGGAGHDPWVVTAGADGSFSTTW